MSIKHIVISYDDETAEAGDPIDLFEYLQNELCNGDIACKLLETDKGLHFAGVEFAECYDDHS